MIFIFICNVSATGDAVRADRRQRVHTRFPVPVLSAAGVRGGARERDAEAQMSARRHRLQAAPLVRLLQPLRGVTLTLTNIKQTAARLGLFGQQRQSVA